MPRHFLFQDMCSGSQDSPAPPMVLGLFFHLLKTLRGFQWGERQEYFSSHGNLLGWSKRSFGFFHQILWILVIMTKCHYDILVNLIHYFWFKNCNGPVQKWIQIYQKRTSSRSQTRGNCTAARWAKHPGHPWAQG